MQIATVPGHVSILTEHLSDVTLEWEIFLIAPFPDHFLLVPFV